MEITQTLEKIIKDSGKLIAQLLRTKYAFALWRSPQSHVAYLMIDITNTKPVKVDLNVWPLEDQHECFVVNAYENSHPPTPEIIKGDIVITLNPDSQEIKLSPKVSSQDLETFLKGLKVGKSKEVQNPSFSESGEYEKYVEKAIENIQSNGLQKVVLSRYKDHDLPTDFHPYSFFKKIAEKYQNAFCYLISSSEHGLWIGATPERLITIEDHKHFITDALAGTQPIEADTNLADIAWTQKEIEEQAMVSRYIIDCFKKIRLREFDEVGPKTVKAGNLAHLKTSFSVNMTETNSPNLGSVMLDLLHPTSAVCGFPREQAHRFIRENEDFDRELFAGFLGPVNFENATRLFVNLRCMKVEGKKARLFAGAGITADSNPKKELKETEYKMNTLLSALLSE